MTTKLTAQERQVITGILKRIDADHLLSFEADSIFEFTNLSSADFLIELPKVVSILSAHKNEFRYNAFIRSMSIVVQIISEVSFWKFCLNSLQDLLESLQEGS